MRVLIAASNQSLDRLTREDNIDVLGCVNAMRQQRSAMVQNEPQYIYLHKLLLDAVNNYTFNKLRANRFRQSELDQDPPMYYSDAYVAEFILPKLGGSNGIILPTLSREIELNLPGPSSHYSDNVSPSEYFKNKPDKPSNSEIPPRHFLTRGPINSFDFVTDVLSENSSTILGPDSDGYSLSNDDFQTTAIPSPCSPCDLESFNTFNQSEIDLENSFESLALGKKAVPTEDIRIEDCSPDFLNPFERSNAFIQDKILPPIIPRPGLSVDTVLPSVNKLRDATFVILRNKKTGTIKVVPRKEFR